MDIPVARGQRIPWDDVPDRVRAAIEAELGSPVVRAVTQPLGFSPAVAARLTTAGGRRAFVKAVPPDVNPDSPGIYRREIEICRGLPPGLPAPRLTWWLDEGPGGWVALLFEDLDGRQPSLPWSGPELELAVGTLDELARLLRPSPLDVPQAGAWMAAEWPGWSMWLDQPPADLDPWVRERLPELAALQAAAADLGRGDALVHGDVRSDNLVLADGRCWVTDWAWPRNGADWIDTVLFAHSVEVEGGPAADDVLLMTEPGRRAPREGVTAIVAAFTGMLSVRSRAPAPPGLPDIRAFQAAYARAGVAWLRRLLA